MATHHDGSKITLAGAGKFQVPDTPTILYIEGDGTGPDIWRATQPVLDAAVAKAYGGARRIAWQEVLAGEKAFKEKENYLPEESLAALREYRVALKGPLTTPIGGGIRSLNVTLRQVLDLYACIRPVRYYDGVPSPMKEPQKINMVIFRENTEDVYAGMEWPAMSPEARRLIDFLNQELGCHLEPAAAIGIKPMTGPLLQAPRPHGPEKRHRAGLDQRHPDAQGQHHEVHRGGFPELGLRSGPGGVRREGDLGG